MSSKRIISVEYIRALAMLGVIGIHVGSQYLSNPACNIHLIAVFETLSRFSVPIFFFISAFGLFYRLDISQPIDYKALLKKRLPSIVMPYLIWSLLYLLFFAVFYRCAWIVSPSYILRSLILGFACYHLYFLVILIWFYLTLPLWVLLIRRLTPARLGLLFIVQIAVNYYSSYILKADFTWPLLNTLIEFRLNYFVPHYLLIFVLGALAALHLNDFLFWLHRHRTAVNAAFILSSAALLGHYYYLIYCQHYSAASAINIVHQLSPCGVAYTAAACGFFFNLFERHKFSAPLDRLLCLSAQDSYFIYLFHPVIIHYLFFFMTRYFIITAPLAIIFYLLTFILSLAAAELLRRHFPRLNSFLLHSKH